MVTYLIFFTFYSLTLVQNYLSCGATQLKKSQLQFTLPQFDSKLHKIYSGQANMKNGI